MAQPWFKVAPTNRTNPAVSPAFRQRQQVVRPNLVGEGLNKLRTVGMFPRANVCLVPGAVLYIGRAILRLDPLVYLETSTLASLPAGLIDPSEILNGMVRVLVVTA